MISTDAQMPSLMGASASRRICLQMPPAQKRRQSSLLQPALLPIRAHKWERTTSP
jgi:hypothetical protein